MNGFEGIPMWKEQHVMDGLFISVLILLFVFVLALRSNYMQFVIMLQDIVIKKRRKNLFEGIAPKHIAFTRYMVFQSLTLCAICLFAIIWRLQNLKEYSLGTMLMGIGFLLMVLLFIHLFRKSYAWIVGWVFLKMDESRFLKVGYNAVISVWGLLLFIFSIYLIYPHNNLIIVIILFALIYIISRFVLIYQSIRIFNVENIRILFLCLYLCGQEIVPLILLYRGMVYLYNFIDTNNLWY